MDLLLDVNIVLDICTPRPEWFPESDRAVRLCARNGGRVWLYTGSVQTYEYNLRSALLHESIKRGKELSIASSKLLARKSLKLFAEQKHWLAALAGEGDVFDSDDPENEQLIRALERFPAGNIKLMTRDQRLLDACPDKTISPEEYCKTEHPDNRLNFIDLAAQQNTIRPPLEKNIHTVLHHGRYILGPEVLELEEKLAEFVGVKHCVGVSSGTDALLMCLMAQGIGPGDAVFTTPFTFIATAEVISLLGATPVFVDIDPETYNLDPEKLKLAIKAVKANDPAIYPLPHTSHAPLSPKGIITVDLFGLPAEYDTINTIAEEENLFVLEDAAQGLGGVYKGRQAGRLAHLGITSFFPAKPLGCYGDGGAIFTDDENLADIVRSIRVHGKGTHKYDNIRIGVNARLHTMQAAILLPKLEIFPREIEKRQQVAVRYSSGLQNSPLVTPHVPDNLQSAWAQYSLLADDRQAAQDTLKNLGIPSAVYYGNPLHLQPAYHHLQYAEGDMPVAEYVSQHIFSLPMHPYLDDKEIDSVVAGLTGSVSGS